MKTILLALLFVSAVAGAEERQRTQITPSFPYTISQPYYDLYNGALGSSDYGVGAYYVPKGRQYQQERRELVVTLEPQTQSYARVLIQDIYGDAADSWAYGSTTLMMNHGAGLANGDYVRVEGGTGPNIAHKTAVRGDSKQWAVWGYQINMGPGAKAALYIGGDNPQLEGRTADAVPNVIVVQNTLDVKGSVFQWNATQESSGVFLRVFKGSKLVFEVTSDGVVRAKRYEVLP